MPAFLHRRYQEILVKVILGKHLTLTEELICIFHESWDDYEMQKDYERRDREYRKNLW